MKTSPNIEAVRKLCERWAWLSEKEFAELLAQTASITTYPFPVRKRLARRRRTLN